MPRGVVEHGGGEVITRSVSRMSKGLYRIDLIALSTMKNLKIEHILMGLKIDTDPYGRLYHLNIHVRNTCFPGEKLLKSGLS